MDFAIVLVLLAVACLGLICIIVRTPWAQSPVIAVLCVLACSVCVVLSLIAPPPSLTAKMAVAATTIAAATFAGWPVTASTLSVALRVPVSQPSAELPATGWIGLAERFGFSLSLVLGLPEVAALLVGVKALGTYAAPDALGNTTPASRVLGTLVSISWALFATAAYLVMTV